MGGLFPFAQLLEGSGGSRFQRTLEAISAQSPTHVQMVRLFIFVIRLLVRSRLRLIAHVCVYQLSLILRQSGLSELLETLSLSSEEVLVMSGFSVDKFVPAVVTLIRFSPTMDILLLAARVLSSILELFPGNAIPKAIAEGVVPSLCEKLMEIEYMDVAELALQIFERIVCKPESLTSQAAAAEYRHAVIQENGFVALLQFVDFFPIEIQRSAARIVCQLCTNFPVAMAGKLHQGFSLITNLLHSFDSEILQNACEAMRKLGESKSFSESSQISMLIASDEVCNVMVKHLAAYGSGGADPSAADSGASSATQLSSAGYTSILKFMSCVLSSSSLGSQVAPAASSTDSVKLVWRLRFVTLPPIVTALLAKEAAMEDNQFLRDTLKLVIVLLPIPEELKTMKSVPDQVISFAHEILPSIICVYDSTSRSDLRYECLGVIYRSCSIIYLKEEPFTSREHAELSRLAAFLARVLRPKGTSRAAKPTEKDLLPVHLALQIIEASLAHASARGVVIELFERHGVATAIRFYAGADRANAKNETEGAQKQPDTYEVVASSSRLVDEYLGKVSADTSLVVQLQAIVEELQVVLTNNVERSDVELERSIYQVLQKMQSVVHRGDDLVTAHEIACSGLVKALTRVLSIAEGKRAFSAVFFGVESRNNDFVFCLVRCVQNAIASEKDAFSAEYQGSQSTGSHSSSVSNDLDQLTQHIKVRVAIDEEDGKESISVANTGTNITGDASEAQEQQQQDEDQTPGNWFKKHALRRSSGHHDANHVYKRNKKGVHDTVVLVEPLARIETMEEFITDKLFGTRSSASILDELTGRNNADDENEQKEGDGEDEEKEKKVQAFYKGKKLPADMSILEAIVKFGGGDQVSTTDSNSEAAGSSSIELNRIWSSSPHKITFRVLSATSLNKRTSDADSSVEEFKVQSDTRGDDVQAALQASNGSSQLGNQWWDNVWDLLTLLKLVRELVLSSERVDHSKIVFTNNFLCLQVNRVLQQPVRVVTNALPLWCFRLVNDFAFVLDYDTRYHFTYSISCGSARAIQYLCRSVWKRAVMEEPVSAARGSAGNSRRRTRDGGNRSRTAALVNISRMVKLPRLKVRVARSRLLQSAMKLLAIYGGKKAVIEIEFLGEVGTGLGPTTEFFTLICQEIQSRHLQMWRDENKQPSTALKDEEKEEKEASDSTQASLPVRGYHRVAVYHCAECTRVRFPHCSVHKQLLTHEKKGASNNTTNSNGATNNDKTSDDLQPVSTPSTPQCAQCLDAQDWYSVMATCDCGDKKHDESSEAVEYGKQATTSLKWWILSDEEVQYLAKVYPRKASTVKHPVLQCAHCDTVNFPGTDAGIVVMDGDRMVSRSGRRMYERDYRAVTKHVSPLCEGTPLNTIVSLLARDEVDRLVEYMPRSPEVLESEVESLNYLNETSQFSDGGPAVDAPHGLFPKPLLRDNGTAGSSVTTVVDEEEEKAKEIIAASSASVFSTSLVDLDALSWFTFLGRFVAQTLLDERLLNLPFSRPFLRALRGEKLAGDGVELTTSLGFVSEFDPSIGGSLRYLYDLVCKFEQQSGSDEVETWREEVASMCLAFTLVGDSSIELRPQGADVDVTLENLREYVRLNVVFLLDTTISKQVAAFQRGFEQICGSSPHQKHFLRVFDVQELEQMFCDTSSGSSMWDREGVELREHMVCDHGFTSESKAIADLVAILCELSIEEQRLFVRFVTGANRLPVGGLAKLEPKLTVVRKLSEMTNHSHNGDEGSGGGFSGVDAVLPSASTCTNYLKLPEYSSREVMKQRLLYCIREGQGSFHLS